MNDPAARRGRLDRTWVAARAFGRRHLPFLHPGWMLVKRTAFHRRYRSSQERFTEIYRQLARRPDAGRGARFVCALAVAHGDRILFETTQTVEGEIAGEPAGTDGFGYDPIFFYPPYGRTLAEVTRQEKLAVAHRGKAFRALANWLVTHRIGGDGG